jgi:hypothetical protein
MDSQAILYGMEHDDEVWKDVAGSPGYEVSNFARVRSWRRPGKGKGRRDEPVILGGGDWNGRRVYGIGGYNRPIDDLMMDAFGEGEDYEGFMEDAARELTQYERNEVVQAEGYKTAPEVALEFRLETARVRQIWDGDER